MGVAAGLGDVGFKRLFRFTRACTGLYISARGLGKVGDGEEGFVWDPKRLGLV